MSKGAIQEERHSMRQYMLKPMLRSKKREAVLQELKSHPSSSLPAKSLGMIIQEYLEDHKFEIKFSTYAR